MLLAVGALVPVAQSSSCDQFAALHNLRLNNPAEWCGAGPTSGDRRASQEVCEASYIVRNNGLLSRCSYIVITSTSGACSSAVEQYDCTFHPPPPAPPPLTSICPQPPCAAALLGDVGLTTAGGTDARSNKVFLPGENIFGPFEAGFSSQQDNILSGLGCNPGSLGHVA